MLPLAHLGCLSIALTNAPQGAREEENDWGQEEPLPNKRSAEHLARMLPFEKPIQEQDLSTDGHKERGEPNEIPPSLRKRARRRALHPAQEATKEKCPSHTSRQRDDECWLA
jgi:hypothetical protein